MRWIFFVLLAANVAVLVGHFVQTKHQERLLALNTSGDTGVVSGAPLVLVSELSDQQRKELSKARSVVVAESKPQPPTTVLAVDNKSDDKAEIHSTFKAETPNQCLTLGPISSAAQAEQISQRLMAIRIIADMVDLDAPGNPEYWVILPPFSDEKQALMKLRELQGREISAQIIPTGELANAISFGLHGQQDDADKQAADLNSMGYKVQVKAMPVMRKEKWLALSERQTPKLNDEIWHGLKKDFPGVEKHIKNCR